MVSRSLILFEEYKKAVPDLIISDQERQKLEIENKNKIITELEKKDEVIEELQEENRQMDARIIRLEDTNS